MKKWKGLVWIAVAAGLAILLAAALWGMGGPRSGPVPPSASPSPSAAAPSAPASQTPTPSPSLRPSPAPSASVSPTPTPSPSAGPFVQSPDPEGALAEADGSSPAPAPQQEEEAPQAAEGCTLSVRCDVILRNMDRLNPDKAELVPADGALIAETEEEFEAGESAFDLLRRVCARQGVHLEFSITPGYGSAYIEGIGNLYEFDCGDRSGWIYRVNGQVPSKGCSAYTLQPGDKVEFLYTCDWGSDL